MLPQQLPVHKLEINTSTRSPQSIAVHKPHPRQSLQQRRISTHAQKHQKIDEPRKAEEAFGSV